MIPYYTMYISFSNCLNADFQENLEMFEDRNTESLEHNFCTSWLMFFFLAIYINLSWLQSTDFHTLTTSWTCIQLIHSRFCLMSNIPVHVYTYRVGAGETLHGTSPFRFLKSTGMSQFWLRYRMNQGI
jgi:hypothetical protein